MLQTHKDAKYTSITNKREHVDPNEKDFDLVPSELFESFLSFNKIRVSTNIRKFSNFNIYFSIHLESS